MPATVGTVSSTETIILAAASRSTVVRSLAARVRDRPPPAGTRRGNDRRSGRQGVPPPPAGSRSEGYDAVAFRSGSSRPGRSRRHGEARRESTYDPGSVPAGESAGHTVTTATAWPRRTCAPTVNIGGGNRVAIGLDVGELQQRAVGDLQPHGATGVVRPHKHHAWPPTIGQIVGKRADRFAYSRRAVTAQRLLALHQIGLQVRHHGFKLVIRIGSRHRASDPPIICAYGRYTEFPVHREPLGATPPPVANLNEVCRLYRPGRIATPTESTGQGSSIS